MKYVLKVNFILWIFLQMEWIKKINFILYLYFNQLKGRKCILYTSPGLWFYCFPSKGRLSNLMLWRNLRIGNWYYLPMLEWVCGHNSTLCQKVRNRSSFCVYNHSHRIDRIRIYICKYSEAKITREYRARKEFLFHIGTYLSV